MKKFVLLLLIVSVLFLSSCGGTLTGAYLGGSLGSAIGGISNGPRGHDMGLLIGTVGGAVIGAAVETAVEQKEAEQRAEDQRQYQAEKARLAANREARQTRASVSENNADDVYAGGNYSGNGTYDDTFDIDFGEEGSRIDELNVPEQDGENLPARIEIQNVRFLDSDGTNTIKRGEQCEISFEIYNAGGVTAYNIEPSVVEKSSGGHIQVSPSILVESLAADKGIRYTARILADNSLKDGTADFEITVTLDGQPTDTDMSFSIPTSKN